jgi:hypothetical protein
MKKFPITQNDKVLVCGHRGQRCYGIENTLTAFRMAIADGVDMIETDVRLTKDGHPVLIHDEFVDRTTNGHGRVKDLTLSQIKEFDATVNANIKVKKDNIPTLAEALELFKLYDNLYLNIELKDYPEDGEKEAYKLADITCDMIIEMGLENRTLINSFSGKLLEYVYKKYGDKFYYHGFYPWFILGEMETDPESFISVACMQHRVLLEDGVIEKCADNMCPKEWFDYLLNKGIMPLMAPSLKEYPLYDLAFSYGSRIVNPDNPKSMIEHLNNKEEKD